MQSPRRARSKFCSELARVIGVVPEVICLWALLLWSDFEIMKVIDLLPSLGNLIFAIALLFSFLIILIEWVERRRDGQRERKLLDTIEREYWLYRRLGRL